MAKQIIKAGVNQPSSFVTTDINGALETSVLKTDLAYTNQIAQPNGIASLDASGKVPLSQMPDALVGAVVYQGTWNASTNTPTITSGTGTKGDYYVVNVAGNTTIDGISGWQVGDWIIFNGTTWEKVDNSLPDVLDTVLSGFAPITGTIVATDTVLQAFDKTQGQIDALVAVSGNFIPLTGTVSGDPVTGNIEVDAGVQLYNSTSIFEIQSDSITLTAQGSTTTNSLRTGDNIGAGSLGALIVNAGAVSNFVMITNSNPSNLTLNSNAQENTIFGFFPDTSIDSIRNFMMGFGGSNVYNTNADSNISMGACSGNTYNGSYNVGIGISSGNIYNDASSNNVHMGLWNGITYTSGSSFNMHLGSGTVNTYNNSGHNVTLGLGASNTYNTASYNILLGQNSANSFASGADNNIVFGNKGGNLFNGSANIVGGIGGGSSFGSNSIMLGFATGNQMGDFNTIIGNAFSNQFINGAGTNFFTGYSAGVIVDTSNFNTVTGRATTASRDFTILNSSCNFLFGQQSDCVYDSSLNGIFGGNLRGVFTGSSNVVMGYNYNAMTGVNSVNGNYGTFMGQHIDMTVTGDNHTMIGRTMTATVGGAANTLVGYFGDYAGLINIQGQKNTLLGTFNGGGVHIDNASNFNVLIGNMSGISLTGTNNKVIVPNLNFYSGSTLISSLTPGGLSTSRNWLLPDASGTIALTSDIAAFVKGPVSAVDNAIARFDATTGKLIQNSGVLIDDSNNISGIGYLEIGDVTAPANPANGFGRIYKKTGNAGLFWKPDAAGAEVNLTSSSGTPVIKRMYQFSLTGEASSTIGQLAKAADKGASANPSGKPSTSSGDPGINNGAVDPYIVPETATIKKVRIKFAGAAVGTGTVGTPTVRLRIYRVDYNTRTQLGSDIDITITTTGVGTFGNTAANAFQLATSSALSIAVNAGDLIGMEFINQASTNNGINAIANLFAVIETDE